MIKIEFQNTNNFYFELKNKNGNVLFKSVSFVNEDEMKSTISLLKNNPNQSLMFERKTNHQGLFHFNLKSNTGKNIGTSEHYNSEAGMENGIKNLMNAINSDFTE